MTTKNMDYKKTIATLLGNYVDGWDIFKKASDWDHPATLKLGIDDDSLPKSWLELADRVISIIAHEKYKISTYPNIIEIIDSDQMRDAYTKNGMPISDVLYPFLVTIRSVNIKENIPDEIFVALI